MFWQQKLILDENGMHFLPGDGANLHFTVYLTGSSTLKNILLEIAALSWQWPEAEEVAILYWARPTDGDVWTGFLPAVHGTLARIFHGTSGHS